MKKIIFLFIAIIALQQSINAQTKVGDVTLPNTLKSGSNNLVLNGGGTREKYFMDMYVAGLYVDQKSNDANAIINANKPTAIKIQIVSNMITSAKMQEAVTEGFEKSTKGKTQAIKDKIAQFTKAFADEIKPGDVFDIIYTNDVVQVLKNNKPKAEIQGLDFKKAVFGIWLCDNPADDDLKKQLLGGK